MPPKKPIPPPPPGSKTTKKRTTINSGGLGRFGEKLKKMTGSKDDLYRDSSPAPADSAETAPHLSPQKDKIPQDGPQDPKTPSSSTPFNSPTATGERRSPQSMLGSSSDASRLSNIPTPYLQSLNDDSEADQIMFRNPNAGNVQLMTEKLSERIEQFGLDFRQTVGWKDQFEAEGRKFHQRVNVVIDFCLQEGLLEDGNKAYELRDNLNANLSNLRKFADAEENAPAAGFLREPSVTPRSGDQIRATPRAQVETSNPAATDGEAPTGQVSDPALQPVQRDRMNSFPAQMSTMKTKIDSVESSIKIIDKGLTDITAKVDAKVDATEMAALKKQVAQVREDVRNINVPGLKTAFDEMNAKIAAQEKNSVSSNKMIANMMRDLQALRETQKAMGLDQQDIRAQVELLNDVTDADLIPQLNERRVAFEGEQNQEDTDVFHVDPMTRRMDTGLSTQGIGGQTDDSHPSGGRSSGPTQWTASSQTSSSQRGSNNHGTRVTGSSRLPDRSQLELAVRRNRSQTTSSLSNNQQQESNVSPRINGLHRLASNEPGLQQHHGLTGQGQTASGENSPHHSTSSDTGPEATAGRLAVRLKEEAESLVNSLYPAVSDSLTKSEVKDIHNSKLSSIEKERVNVANRLDKYEERVHPDLIDLGAIETASEAIKKAKKWATGMRDKYSELGCSKRGLESKHFQSLKKFGVSSEQNVFEFFQNFEVFTEEQASPEQKAKLLYDQYLSEEVKQIVVKEKESFTGMKNIMVTRFGDVRVITGNLLQKIVSETMPAEDSPKLADYYRKLNFIMESITQLQSTEGIAIAELNEHVHSYAFMQQILAFLPYRTRLTFIDRLELMGINVLQVRGERAFTQLTKFIKHQYIIHEGNSKCVISPERKISQSSNRQSKKAVNCVSEDTEIDETDNHSVHFSGPSGSARAKPQQDSGKNQNSQRSSPGKKLKFPCPLYPANKHDHELGQCKLFFGMKPWSRRQKVKGKVCFNCCRSDENCSKDGCKRKIPDMLVCTECKDYAESKGSTPCNVLFCTFKAHQKPTNDDLSKCLQKYLHKFNPKETASTISMAALIHLSAHASTCKDHQSGDCTCKVKSKSSKPDPDEKIPTMDSNTGERIDVADELIIPESKDDAVYCMQLLHLGGQQVLTFYDRGANINLIDGKMAEEISLKVVDDKTINIGTAGGGKMWSGYGTYAMNLGPNEDGEYYEITAQGMNKCTPNLPRYELKDINREVARSGQFQERPILPKYIGGDRAKLMLGVKNTAIEPYLLFNLPCGLGIYKSPLKDVFGSRICYGGPHSAFTEVNRMAGANFVHMSVFFMQAYTQYKNSFYPALSHVLEPEIEETLPGIFMAKQDPPYSKIATETGLELNPSAVNSADLQQMGIFEVDQEDCNPCKCDGHDYATVGVYKAKVPVSKRKEYIDESDQALLNDIRCDICKNCKKCSLSDREKMISLNDLREQEAIEKAVDVRLEEGKVYVDLPFIKEPVTNLKKKHRGKGDNYAQAYRIYQTQCRKPETVKAEIRKAHQGLVEKGFLTRFDDLDQAQRDIIDNAGFQHAMPWRVVQKPDSISTPYRMVVDASCTGLNDLLAKGTNRMQKIHSVMIRNRCNRYAWTSDISKLYNQLHLTDAALPYGLFLYDDALDAKKKPEVWVMLRAWYGVTSTGNQAAEALERLTKLLAEEYPLAHEIVTLDLYVDDAFSGADTEEMARKQVEQMSGALNKGGFTLKYVVKSGEKPCQEAAGDEGCLKVLGYRWAPEADEIGPGFSELNFNPKKRGAKQPNPFPVKSPNDVDQILNSKHITRRMVVAKLAEFWDPCGFWEPYKAQLKLDNHKLNGLDWDKPLDQESQQQWRKRFHEFLQIPQVSIPRCIVPTDAVDLTSMRLICLADAGAEAGGCAIYGGFERPDGTWSCSLLTSRSKIMNQTIPRNELESIKLMAETAEAVKGALGNRVKDVLYFTDSTVALCWIHNKNKKLRMFTMHRVSAIRASILGPKLLDDEVEVPLYHIDTSLNLADLLTKRHDIKPKDLGKESQWQNGMSWMTQPLEDMPITRYGELTVTKEAETKVDEECMPPIYLTSGPVTDGVNFTCDIDDIELDQDTDQQAAYATAKKMDSFLGDIIHLGWKLSIGTVKTLLLYGHELKHRSHMKGDSAEAKETKEVKDCKMCAAQNEVGMDPHEIEKVFCRHALDYFFRQESDYLKTVLSAKQLKMFTEIDGILYYESRLNEENPVKQTDLGFDVFFDNTEIKSMLPAVSAKSKFFYAYAVYVHTVLKPHTGIEGMFREIYKVMYPVHNAKRTLESIRKNCTRCRLIVKKTIEMRMLNHPAARTTIAPPFYHVMADTAFGFKSQAFKNARKVSKGYALVLVCLLTGATNILMLEGLECQDIVQAIERHSWRHGVPAVMSIDNGTQLISLEHARFNLRTLQDTVKKSMSMEIRVSNPKAHEERGRVEAKVRILREMLEKLAINTDRAMTPLQWETLFAKISNQIDDLPLAKCNKSNVRDLGWDVITPNRLKLGRNNNRSLEASINLDKWQGVDNLLKRNEEIQKFWYQMFLDKLHYLIPRPSKWTKTEDIKVGDIVVFTYSETPGSKKDNWKLGKVIKKPRPNSVEIQYPTNLYEKGVPKMKTLQRSPRDCSIIVAADEIAMNSSDHHEELIKGAKEH